MLMHVLVDIPGKQSFFILLLLYNLGFKYNCFTPLIGLSPVVEIINYSNIPNILIRFVKISIQHTEFVFIKSIPTLKKTKW